MEHKDFLNRFQIIIFLIMYFQVTFTLIIKLLNDIDSNDRYLFTSSIKSCNSN